MEIQEIHIHLLQISHLKGTIKASHWGPPFLKTFSWNEFHDSNRGIDRATTHVAFDLGEWAWNAQVFAWETSSNHPPNKKQTPGDVPGCFKVDPYNNGSLQSHVIPIYLDSNIPLYHLYSDDVPDLTCNFLVFLFGQTLLLFQSFNSTKNSLSLVPNFSVTSFLPRLSAILRLKHIKRHKEALHEKVPWWRLKTCQQKDAEKRLRLK